MCFFRLLLIPSFVIKRVLHLIPYHPLFFVFVVSWLVVHKVFFRDVSADFFYYSTNTPAITLNAISSSLSSSHHRTASKQSEKNKCEDDDGRKAWHAACDKGI